jgi:hypothetical protein
MSPLTRAVSEFASEMALIPLAWLVVLTIRKRPRDVAWWWLALALAVSWVADTAALWVDPWFIGLVYPVTQAALVAAVFLDRLDAARFVVALVVVGVTDALWHGVEGPDLLLRTVAWGAVTGIVWERPALGRLRTALLVAFGLALLCWWGYAIAPGWWSWGAYQLARLAGILLFCFAAAHPAPRFTLARRES